MCVSTLVVAFRANKFGAQPPLGGSRVLQITGYLVYVPIIYTLHYRSCRRRRRGPPGNRTTSERSRLVESRRACTLRLRCSQWQPWHSNVARNIVETRTPQYSFKIFGQIKNKLNVNGQNHTFFSHESSFRRGLWDE